MDLLNSLFVSVFGLSVVFFALVLLIVMINVMSAGVRKSTERQAAKDKAAAAAAAASVTRSAAAPKAAAPSASTASGVSEKMIGIYTGPPELKLTGVDERTAAMIMAIICDESGVAANELYFKSIKALD